MAFWRAEGWFSVAAVFVVGLPVHAVEEGNQTVCLIEGSLRGLFEFEP
ncbi:hypothetical protein [Methylorubrum extorquens]|uniref:Uncharacterized protein n=1 Tax=Methylorubrum extorquens DSM 13060 TaxID=882800 RepID=H1KBZ5_METEX|nr:hypothetical protein [Methylorubrum extorquens]EHP94992.1 hypothetical protein MetexDRAFT_0157 [Methylorubrum extorquens DSM 13060]